MILHLANDEKVINRAIELFEKSFPQNNLFVIFGKKPFHMVKSGKNIISYKEYDERKYSHLISSVIIHYLTDKKVRFMKRHIDRTIPAYWIMWGSDLYHRMLESKGFEIRYKKGNYDKRICKYVLTPFNKINDAIRTEKRVAFVNKHIKYLVTSTIEDDYEIALKYFPGLKEKEHKEFSYYPIDSIINKESPKKFSGNGIQLGHSASLTDNHEYVFNILSQFDTSGRKIITPLSYSGNKRYRKYVINKGKELFGEDFDPVLKFLPLEKYNKLMASASVAIYGNWRQEAVGNILISLYLGEKIFFSKRNPILKWAERHGFKVFELENMTQEELDAPLDEQAAINNRKILLEHFNSTELYGSIKKEFLEI
ncbi:MAG: TDP-N-acetylfucosamine:lipid II N-acetylfucosaminyltransferase [Bacteroidales bacterium]|jgi:hypothetical protein|nr:TDP-N-acetylfucosamine:lipid II N-acetylfucosaminyltransferase [Bacteroidales bacterium]